MVANAASRLGARSIQKVLLAQMLFQASRAAQYAAQLAARKDNISNGL